jgi:predicted nucleic acid-binding protein
MPTPRVYWDTCLFIDLLQRTPERIEILSEYIAEAQKGKLCLVTSAFTLAEVVKVGRALPEEDERIIRDFFENPYILIQQLDRAVAEIARGIVRSHSHIKPPDAVHIASAVVAEAPTLLTYDREHLIPKSELIGSPPLKIEEPQRLQIQRNLFTATD